MPIRFNHATIAAHDRHESAAFFANLFGLDEPTVWGPFALVALDNGAFLQFAEPSVDDIQPRSIPPRSPSRVYRACDPGQQYPRHTPTTPHHSATSS